MPKPIVSLSSITFSDGTKIPLEPGEIIVIVGPNNSGKSAALRAINERIQNPSHSSLVVSGIETARTGSLEDLTQHLEAQCRRTDNPPGNPSYAGMGVSVHKNALAHYWTTQEGLGQILRLFCRLLTADERISAANSPGKIDFTREAAQHPIHLMERNDNLEKKLSAYFREAFGTELIVHRNAGNALPLMVGSRPKPKKGQDRVSYEYVRELEKLPRLDSQGDGMRSFAGLLLNIFLGEESIVLIDEPEAFLHPPQARLLGRMLSRETSELRQVIVATHSTDILRGILDAPKRKVRVIRVTRDGPINRTTSLDNEKIKSLWADPLLRYSNILDGLFHERVVVCESDGDCRFYSAIADALPPSASARTKPLDILYTHCGGKARMPTVIRSLEHVNVSVVATPDFDVLNDESPLREIVEAFGGDWSAFATDWKRVKLAVDSKKPELGTEETKQEIQKILSSINASPFPKHAKTQIEKILRKSSPWSIAKSVGAAYVPSGDASVSLGRLLKNLRALGIYIPEGGELESFAKTVPSHGPAWVNEVLTRDLTNDPELRNAREFVSQFAR